MSAAGTDTTASHAFGICLACSSFQGWKPPATDITLP